MNIIRQISYRVTISTDQLGSNMLPHIDGGNFVVTVTHVYCSISMKNTQSKKWVFRHFIIISNHWYDHNSSILTIWIIDFTNSKLKDSSIIPKKPADFLLAEKETSSFLIGRKQRVCCRTRGKREKITSFCPICWEINLEFSYWLKAWENNQLLSYLLSFLIGWKP